MTLHPGMTQENFEVVPLEFFCQRVSLEYLSTVPFQKKSTFHMGPSRDKNRHIKRESLSAQQLINVITVVQ
jgi:hypothetical protein